MKTVTDPAGPGELRRRQLSFLAEVVAQARAVEESWKAQLRAEVAAWLAYELTFGKRFTVTHDQDPPWDHSGELREVAGGFDPQEYEALGDFLEEPTGQRKPSFQRGYGWNYENQEQALDERFRDFAGERLLEVAEQVRRQQGWRVSDLLEPDDPGIDATELDMMTLHEIDGASQQELVGEYEAIDVLPRWYDEAIGWSVRELLAEGAAAAHLRRHEEHVVATEQRRVAAERRARSTAVFDLFVRDFEARIGPFPRGHVFSKNDSFWPALQALLLERWTAEERDLIADHLSASNAVDVFLKIRHPAL